MFYIKKMEEDPTLLLWDYETGNVLVKVKDAPVLPDGQKLMKVYGTSQYIVVAESRLVPYDPEKHETLNEAVVEIENISIAEDSKTLDGLRQEAQVVEIIEKIPDPTNEEMGVLHNMRKRLKDASMEQLEQLVEQSQKQEKEVDPAVQKEFNYRKGEAEFLEYMQTIENRGIDLGKLVDETLWRIGGTPNISRSQKFLRRWRTAMQVGFGETKGQLDADDFMQGRLPKVIKDDESGKKSHRFWQVFFDILNERLKPLPSGFVKIRDEHTDIPQVPFDFYIRVLGAGAIGDFGWLRPGQLRAGSVWIRGLQPQQNLALLSNHSTTKVQNVLRADIPQALLREANLPPPHNFRVETVAMLSRHLASASSAGSGGYNLDQPRKLKLVNETVVIGDQEQYVQQKHSDVFYDAALIDYLRYYKLPSKRSKQLQPLGWIQEDNSLHVIEAKFLDGRKNTLLHLVKKEDDKSVKLDDARDTWGFWYDSNKAIYVTHLTPPRPTDKVRLAFARLDKQLVGIYLYFPRGEGPYSNIPNEHGKRDRFENCCVCKRITTQLCGGCLKTPYCSQECQRLDWQNHLCTGGERGQQ